ncbi:MAG: cob(I)yrinic acid a,c-diamide adenosyltransferase [Pseudomonadota bacterium]
MPDRLTKIVTRGGDAGETSLGDGTRVAKTDPRVALLGDIDELNSWIGVVRANGIGSEVDATLSGVQHDLFDLGGALCFPGVPLLTTAHVERLDGAAETLNEDLPPLKEFILPGGSSLLAWLHVARTVCRRVERHASGFLGGDETAAMALAYLNRLSDYLFIAARYEAKRLTISETLWEKEKSLGTVS